MEKSYHIWIKDYDNATRRTVWVDFSDNDEENLHHSTLPPSTKIIYILIFWLLSYFQHLSLTQFPWPLHAGILSI